MDEGPSNSSLNPEIAPLSSTPQRSNTLWRYVLGISFLLLLCGSVWYEYQKWRAATYAYTIPAVPAVTMYSGEVIDAEMYNSTTAALASILRYWGDSADLSDPAFIQAANTVLSTSTGIEPAQLEHFFAARGYTVETLHIQDPKQFEAYINAQRPIPILFSYIMSTTSKSLVADELIGINLAQSTVVVHDFYRGPTFTIPFSTFNQGWEFMPFPIKRYRYFAIYPSDPARVAARAAANATAPAYPPRTAPMDTLGPIVQPFVFFGRTITSASEQTAAGRLTFVSALIDHPLFGQLHPAIQMFAYSRRALLEIELKQYPQALADAQKAVVMDHDLTTPFAGWGTPTQSQKPFPYLVLSSYYKAVGNTAAAASAYAEGQKIASSTKAK